MLFFYPIRPFSYNSYSENKKDFRKTKKIFREKVVSWLSKLFLEKQFQLRSGVLRACVFILVREVKQRWAWSDSEWVTALQE